MKETQPVPALDLTSSPPIFVLPTHFKPDELHETEDLIFQCGGTLTYDPTEARVFIGRVAQKKRAAFELRARKVWTEEASLPDSGRSYRNDADEDTRADGPARKKLKRGEAEHDLRASTRQARKRSGSVSAASDVSTKSAPTRFLWPDLSDHVMILKLAWLEECLTQEHLLAFEPYIVYTAKIIPNPTGEVSPTKPPVSTRSTKPTTSILERAKAEATTLPDSSASSRFTSRRRFGDPARHSTSPTSTKTRVPKLLRTMTSEQNSFAENPLPTLPNWASGPNASYACCRSTLMKTANEAFISQLTKIKEARMLTLDDIGVRAYSTSIASVAAYPYPITRAEEITRLPGCEAKIAALWREWYESADDDSERYIQTVRDLDADVDLQHLRLFWNIWGVGPETARKFYFEHGWRDLDDVVEFGWDILTRVQQIGVKFYDEFLTKIPRPEVEAIRDVILRHARSVLGVSPSQFGTTADVECVVVGGYRRGKDFSGDVDVILSHREESKTQDLVIDVVHSLESEGWITHTLSLHTTTSDRGQATLPFRTQGRGHGFDSLDKALCVWQDPNFETSDSSDKENDDDDDNDNDNEEGNEDDEDIRRKADPGNEGSEKQDRSTDQPQRQKKNPNIHRRVDIIISSWRTVGCAVLGWSGGTTFQRDIRRFVSKTRGWKFDSSGVRDRSKGLVLDLEGPRRAGPEGLKEVLSPKSPKAGKAAHGKGKGKGKEKMDDDVKEHEGGRHGDEMDAPMDDEDSWQARERRLMDGLGIGYRPPEERCTG